MPLADNAPHISTQSHDRGNVCASYGAWRLKRDEESMAGLSVQSFALALLIAVSAACAAYAGSITTNDPPIATLVNGRTGTIAFEALTPKNSRDLVNGKAAEKSVIAGMLTLPDSANAAANAKVPAMVVVHGSSGVLQNDWEWAKRLNEMGIATFVIDNFTGRGIVETATDYSPVGNGGRSRRVGAAAPARHSYGDRPQADRRDRVFARGVRRHRFSAGADPARRH